MFTRLPAGRMLCDEHMTDVLCSQCRSVGLSDCAQALMISELAVSVTVHFGSESQTCHEAPGMKICSHTNSCKLQALAARGTDSIWQRDRCRMGERQGSCHLLCVLFFRSKLCDALSLFFITARCSQLVSRAASCPVFLKSKHRLTLSDTFRG